MVRKLLRHVYHNFLPAHMRQTLDIFSNLRDRRKIDTPSGKILAIAPHPDDDVIACGGAIYQSFLNDSEITAVYMTDGRKGSTSISEEKLISIRKEEARIAASIIGIKKTIFLDNRDSELALSDKTVSALSEVIKETKPDAVFLPFIMDSHHDHIATNRIFIAALKNLPSVMCYAWGLWTPLSVFNCILDISPYMDIKKKAIESHISQTKEADIVGAVFGLNKYYSVMSGGNGWAEVFIACHSDQYIRLAEVVKW